MRRGLLTCLRLGASLLIAGLGAGAAEAASCSVDDASLSLGTLDPPTGSLAPSAGIISVTCSLGASYAVGLDNGLHALGSARRLKRSASSDYLTYQLYKDVLMSQRFGDQVASERVSGLGAGLGATPVAVYGAAPAGQTAPSGTYGDSVRITVYF